MSSFDIGTPRHPGDIQQFAAVLQESLRFPPLDQGDWLSRYAPADMRLVRVGGRVVAGAVLVAMGQWFGGRSVPMTGVTAVGVVPEYRGRGVGSALMRAVVEEMHGRGVPLSGLYPATQPVYRRMGYEQAGTWTTYKVATGSLALRERDVEIERLGPFETQEQVDQGQAMLAPVYTEVARHEAGHLDRGRWAWQRALWPLLRPTYTFCARRGDRIEGYINFAQVPQPGSNFYDLSCRELVALTPGALRGLLSLLSNHRSMARSVYIVAPPAGHIHMMTHEQDLQVDTALRWMTRVIDVKAALEARGYPPSLAATARFRVRDDVLSANSGTYVLRVAEGRGEVTAEGGDSDVELDIRGLAALYTGHASGLQLRQAGLADGAPEALASLSALFAGPPPWMAEIY